MKPHFLLRNRTLFLGDLFLMIVSVLGSWVLRLDLGPLLMDNLGRLLVMVVLVLIVKPLVYNSFGLYRRLWRYASIQELKLIAIAVTTASILISVIITILYSFQFYPVYPGFSRGVLIIDWMLSMLFVGGLRLSLRILAESQSGSLGQGRYGSRRGIIIGAGSSGALVVREMQKSQSEIIPVCFVDDDPAKQKQQIHGVPVVGTLNELARALDTYRIEEAILAIPSAPGPLIRKITELCLQKGVILRVMPSLNELIGGKVNVSRLREVEITDLLRREPIKIDDEVVGLSLSGRKVLVTGAGGSIGRELCRQIARWGPSELILLGHGENSIFETLLELEEAYPSLPIHAVIADIRNLERLDWVFGAYTPQVVFHAAAHKHVPLMQTNVEEAVTNNILGTRNVLEAARSVSVERLVMISTDKAIRPTTVMGATKRLAEMLVLDAANRSGRAYSIVRFGNVLGSRGSAILRFKQQIAKGGPVTVTHPDMERYFMTIPEAVHLVLQAAATGQGNEVFVLNMGQQVRILDLAEDLIRLSGLEPGKDIEIVFTGLRAGGEKLREELWDEGVKTQPTPHPDILCLAENDHFNGEELNQTVDELVRLAHEGDAMAIIQLMDEVIPGATVRCTPPPDLTSVV